MDERITKITESYEANLKVIKEIETELAEFQKGCAELIEKLTSSLEDINKKCEERLFAFDDETGKLQDVINELEDDESISDEDFDKANLAWSNLLALTHYVEDVEDYCAETSEELEAIKEEFSIDDYIETETEDEN